MSSDRRQHERIALVAQVQLEGGGAVETLSAINISAGGVLFLNERNVAFSMGQQIRVTFNVPDLAPPFAIDAKIVRIVEPTNKPAALAAMWTSSDPAATAGLAQMLWTLTK